MEEDVFNGSAERVSMEVTEDTKGVPLFVVSSHNIYLRTFC